MNCNDKVKLIEIDKCKDVVLKNLVSLYLHDLSEFADDIKMNNEGKYEYGGIDYYFSEKELIPYLIYDDDEVAGFILFNTGKYAGSGQADCSIHELFVAKSFRSRGIATRAVRRLLEMHKGIYRVEQLEKNKLAISFWKRFYDKNKINYDEKVEVIDGLNCFVQIFSNQIQENRTVKKL